MTATQTHAPKVSILIPVFNRKDYIAECIQSALDQTYADIEIVVADNASTDGTWEICQQFSVKDSRVRIFRNGTNIGPVRNWLCCIDKARGEFGKILFSDDLMFPDFLKHTIPYMESTEVGFVSTAALIGTTPDQSVKHYVLPGTPKIASSRYFDLLFNKALNAEVPYSPGAALFRIADMRKNLQLDFPTRIPRDFTKNGAGPDVLLYALTALEYKYVVMLSDTDLFFRAHRDSFTIENRDNAVTNGYWAALAWFARHKLSRSYWMKYVARIWLSKMKSCARLISPAQLGIEYEGAGTMMESVGIVLRGIGIALRSVRFGRTRRANRRTHNHE